MVPQQPKGEGGEGNLGTMLGYVIMMTAEDFSSDDTFLTKVYGIK